MPSRMVIAPSRCFSNNKFDWKGFNQSFNNLKDIQRNNERLHDIYKRKKTNSEEGKVHEDDLEPITSKTYSLCLLTAASLCVLVVMMHKVKVDFDTIYKAIENDSRVELMTNHKLESEKKDYKVVNAEGHNLSYEDLASIAKPVLKDIKSKSSTTEIQFRKYMSMGSCGSLICCCIGALNYGRSLKNGLNNSFLTMLVLFSFCACGAFFSQYLKYFEIYRIDTCEFEDTGNGFNNDGQEANKLTLMHWLNSNIVIMSKQEYKQFEAKYKLEQEEKRKEDSDKRERVEHEEYIRQMNSHRDISDLKDFDEESKDSFWPHSNKDKDKEEYDNYINRDSYFHSDKDDSYSSKRSKGSLNDSSGWPDEKANDSMRYQSTKDYITSSYSGSRSYSTSSPASRERSTNENRLQDLDREINRLEIEKVEREIKNMSGKRS